MDAVDIPCGAMDEQLLMLGGQLLTEYTEWCMLVPTKWFGCCSVTINSPLPSPPCSNYQGIGTGIRANSIQWTLGQCGIELGCI